MTILIRAASISDAGLLAPLNRDVQRLHAEMKPDIFKPDTDNEKVAAFSAAKLAFPENHMRIADASDGPKGHVWFEVQERSKAPRALLGNASTSITCRSKQVLAAKASPPHC